MRIFRATPLAAALAAAGLTLPSISGAANYGTDLNLTMMPAAGGMGGVGIARPQDVGSAVFGNPATLGQLDGTRFMFGATFYAPRVEARHDGSTSGSAWSGDSEAGPYLVPNVAVSQPLGPDTTLGLGLSVIAGVGSDFRGIAGSLDPLAEILVFGANAALSRRVNEHLTLGAAATLAMGLGQAGLNGNTASTSNFGLRGTLGATYAAGGLTLGGYYRTPLSIEYENMVQYGASSYHSPTFEQPREVGLGLAMDNLLGGRLLLGADLVWKDWESAEAYGDLYENQVIAAVGAQLSHGPLRWRIGYSHADSPIRDGVGSAVGDIDSLWLGGGTVPLNPALVQYIQATNAEVIWENQVTLGLGWDINAGLTLDAHAGVALDNEEAIGATEVKAGAWQLGAALTWRF